MHEVVDGGVGVVAGGFHQSVGLEILEVLQPQAQVLLALFLLWPICVALRRSHVSLRDGLIGGDARVVLLVPHEVEVGARPRSLVGRKRLPRRSLVQVRADPVVVDAVLLLEQVLGAVRVGAHVFDQRVLFDDDPIELLAGIVGVREGFADVVAEQPQDVLLLVRLLVLRLLRRKLLLDLLDDVVLDGGGRRVPAAPVEFVPQVVAVDSEVVQHRLRHAAVDLLRHVALQLLADLLSDLLANLREVHFLDSDAFFRYRPAVLLRFWLLPGLARLLRL